MLTILFTFLLLAIYWTDSVVAHSWLHCVDYDPTALLQVGKIQSSACSAWARGIPVDVPFGEDRGFNYQPVQDRACRDPYAGIVQRFTTNRPYRLLWPAKNHVAAPCTNPYIVSRSLQLYAYPVQNMSEPDPGFQKWTQQTYLLHDFQAPGLKGFQNCPDFCPTTDRVPCFGDISYASLSPGTYKFLWVWNFNTNEWFTHCYDGEIGSDGSSTQTPTSRVPTSRVPTSRAPSTHNCVRRWDQCGGRNWKGQTCCQAGDLCIRVNEYYSQCRQK